MKSYRTNILIVHRRIAKDLEANLRRYANGRYVWNPVARKIIAQLEERMDAVDLKSKEATAGAATDVAVAGTPGVHPSGDA